MQKNRIGIYVTAAIVFLMTFLVYLPALRNEFVDWDDNLYIFENDHIRHLNSAFFKWAFLNFYAYNWHPLTWISHALDYTLWGMHPMGHHLTNIILHAVNAFLVVLLVRGLLKASKERSPEPRLTEFPNDRSIQIIAGVTGLLFGIHPVHVESVAWVSERKDLLCALFFLLSLIMYTKYTGYRQLDGTKKGGPSLKDLFLNKQYLLTFGLFVLALLSKPMAVTLPFVFLILDWYPFKRMKSFKGSLPAIVEKLPFVLLSFISSILTILAQRTGGSVAPIPLSIRLPVGAKSLIAYLGKMIVPVNLVPLYPYPLDTSLFIVEYLMAIALVIGITAASLAMVRKQRLWLTAWGYYVITLIPVVGIIQVGPQSMADRYTYLPSLGPFLVMGLVATWFFSKYNESARWEVVVKPLSILTVIIVTISMTFLTFRQIDVWENSTKFWDYVIEKEPASYQAHYFRGLLYKKKNEFDKAIYDFDKAIALFPYYYEAYYYRGVIFDKQGLLDRAIKDLDTAIALNPSYYEAYNSRGQIYEKTGQFNKAIEDYNKTITLDTSSYLAYYNLGIVYHKSGFLDKSIEYYSKSIVINPDYAAAYHNRGAVYFFKGQYNEALNDFNKAIELDKNAAIIFLNRGNLYRTINKSNLAAADFRKACDLGNDEGCDKFRQLARESHFE